MTVMLSVVSSQKQKKMCSAYDTYIQTHTQRDVCIFGDENHCLVVFEKLDYYTIYERIARCSATKDMRRDRGPMSVCVCV